MTVSGEFDRILTWLSPLAASMPGAAGLSDDAATIAPVSSQELVVTTDTMVEGVHFLGRETAKSIAEKLLSVSLSDLAAKGAKPHGYTLNLALTEKQDDVWFEGFCDGLRLVQERSGLGLLGGDSVKTDGPIVLTATLFGHVAKGQVSRRSGADPGDDVYVTGTIGDGALGLIVARGELMGLPGPARDHLIAAYEEPDPPLAFGAGITGLVTASMDVSDGLIGDLGHICAASDVGVEVSAAAVPISDPAAELIADDPHLFVTALTGGDDYQILFTAAPDKSDALNRLADETGTRISRIGTVKEGNGVTVLDGEGTPIEIRQDGYRHF